MDGQVDCPGGGVSCLVGGERLLRREVGKGEEVCTYLHAHVRAYIHTQDYVLACISVCPLIGSRPAFGLRQLGQALPGLAVGSEALCARKRAEEMDGAAWDTVDDRNPAWLVRQIPGDSGSIVYYIYKLYTCNVLYGCLLHYDFVKHDIINSRRGRNKIQEDGMETRGEKHKGYFRGR